jgi:hypothetical protein
MKSCLSGITYIFSNIFFEKINFTLLNTLCTRVGGLAAVRHCYAEGSADFCQVVVVGVT